MAMTVSTSDYMVQQLFYTFIDLDLKVQRQGEVFL